MPEQENLQIVRQLFEAWNAHDPDRLAALLDEGFVGESDTLPDSTRGREAEKQVLQMYTRAFPDLHFDIEQMIASQDYVVTRWRAIGTHRGELMGIPPTNRRAETHGCAVNELKKGKVIHGWIYWDTGTLLRQLGVMPAPAQAAAAR